jgi:NAD-dependent SIR2 family protein deacetylase
VPLEEKLTAAAQALAQADAVLICAGAGMGVDSGLPDFRGPEGFWKAYPAIAKLGFSFEQMANPSWFRTDPHLAWAFYGHRLNLYRKTEPHAGFAQLLRLVKEKAKGFFVFTSNVDGQFQKAGCPEDRIVECHGSIFHLQCARTCCGKIWGAEDENLIVEDETFRAKDPLPKCHYCDGLARPNILMFDDWDWVGDRTEFQRGRFTAWLQSMVDHPAKIAIMEVGAGMAVPTVRYMSETVAVRLKGTLIRLNLREEAVPANQIGLALGAVEGLQKIVERITKVAGL